MALVRRARLPAMSLARRHWQDKIKRLSAYCAARCNRRSDEAFTCDAQRTTALHAPSRSAPGRLTQSVVGARATLHALRFRTLSNIMKTQIIGLMRGVHEDIDAAPSPTPPFLLDKHVDRQGKRPTLAWRFARQSRKRSIDKPFMFSVNFCQLHVISYLTLHGPFSRVHPDRMAS